MDIKIKVIRKKLSYNYKYNDSKLNDYQNCTKNNMIDDFIILDHNKEVFYAKVQTVSNHPRMKHSDTIAPGKFAIKCFVDQRNFNTSIHGIVDALDLNKQLVGQDSMQWDEGQHIGRWLVHSSFYKPGGKDTRAYSGGCIIMSTKDMKGLNKILLSLGVVLGKKINAEMVEE